METKKKAKAATRTTGPPALTWAEMMERIKTNYGKYDDDGEAVRKEDTDGEEEEAARHV